MKDKKDITLEDAQKDFSVIPGKGILQNGLTKNIADIGFSVAIGAALAGFGLDKLVNGMGGPEPEMGV